MTVPTLTPYMVPGAKAVVIVCPGGAYKWLSWDLEGTSAATWLNSIGVSAMILKCDAAAASPDPLAVTMTAAGFSAGSDHLKLPVYSPPRTTPAPPPQLLTGTERTMDCGSSFGGGMHAWVRGEALSRMKGRF